MPCSVTAPVVLKLTVGPVIRRFREIVVAPLIVTAAVPLKLA